jgi:DNA-binding GntR family transcriptional regulator
VPARPDAASPGSPADSSAGRPAGGESAKPVSGEPGRRLAVEGLRRAILAGDMAPGQRLIEEELAGMLAVTRASLRAALFDLTAEGLVERIPNRGARVRTITIDEAVAITECRMALEGLCAAKAAELVTETQASQLRQLGAELERCVADGELLKYSAHNHELHRLVREISGQSVAAALLERLNGQLVRHQFQLSLRPGRPHVSLPEHLAIISAITGRRPAEAEEAARRHLRSVITALQDGTAEPRTRAGRGQGETR